MNNHTALVIKSALDNWNIQIGRVNKLLDELTDEQLLKEVAPGRNRGIYLLGHLTTVHDKMLPLLNFEKQMFPQLENIFLDSPDKKIENIPSAKELRILWKQVNDNLAFHFNNLKQDEWFQKHNSVSETDFEKEPHRNRLNVVLNRTNHLAYHYGQMIFLRTI